MVKRFLKRLMSLTPYVIKRKPVNILQVDPLIHNSPEHMDCLFSQKTFLKKYNSEKRNKLYEYIINHVPDNNLDVVDYGCGPGFFLHALMNIRITNNYFGYEYSEEAIKVASDLCPNAKIHHQDLRDVIGSKYDIAICSQTLEHIIYPEIALQNIINSMNIGGKLILTVPDGRSDSYIGHINFWSEQSWEAWIKSNIKTYKQMQFDRIINEKGFDFLITVLRF